jgi:hypothetical protein
MMPHVTIKVSSRDDDVFGEVPLAPSGLTGVSESQLASAMAGRLPVWPEWQPPAGRPVDGQDQEGTAGAFAN